MNVRRFLDTNILIYAFGDEGHKTEVAGECLNTGGTISVQVLNEFVSVSRRKLGKSWEDVSECLDVCSVLLPEVAPLTIETHRLAFDLCRTAHLSFYDGLIVAAASLSGCTELLTEDMGDGAGFAGVRIVRPW